ncbi:MAG: hypothetical protein AAF892_13935 [Cyanobacteria bacterium P01_D01_bin.71]
MVNPSRKALSRQTVLSSEDRLYIFRTVSALVSVQFDELVFALAPPYGVIPDNCSQGDRSRALLDWVESPTGPGLSAVDDYLNTVISSYKKRFTTITIPGVDLNSLTDEQKIKLAENIERITGVKVQLLEEGSIKLLASGSDDELYKLQQLFESGELSKALNNIPIESVQQADDDTTGVRKARLVEVLRLRGQQIESVLIFV